MTPDQIDAAIAEVRDWLDDYPEGTVLALFEARAWEVKGYADWEALCAAEFPRKVALPRPERRELVGRLREAGMSMPAIAAATGASVGTVHGDIASLSGLKGSEVKGLDGKTYPAKVTTTTRTTEATKVEHAVDLTTGEILGEELTAEQWERENPEVAAPLAPEVEEFLADNGALRAANLRHRFAKWVAYTGEISMFDADEMARIYPEVAESLERVTGRAAEFAAAYAAAVQSNRRLRLIKEA